MKSSASAAALNLWYLAQIGRLDEQKLLNESGTKVTN